MSTSNFAYQYELAPRVRGQTYRIGVRAEPSINDVVSFAVVLFFQRRDGDRIEICKIDDTPHDEGEIHIDRYYRERGAPIKTFDTSIAGYVEAETYMRTNWQRFARLYDDHHGSRLRRDRANG